MFLKWYKIDLKTHRIWEIPSEEGYVYLATGDRQIKETIIADMRISTVFLSMDHRIMGEPGDPPILFETLVFGEGHEAVNLQRCCTYKDAITQHNRTVKHYTDMMNKILQ